MCRERRRHNTSRSHEKALLRVWWEWNAQRGCWNSMSAHREAEKDHVHLVHVSSLDQGSSMSVSTDRLMAVHIDVYPHPSQQWNCILIFPTLWNGLQSLRDLERKLCNFPWFNWVIYIWGIYILIRPSVPQQSHWLTLSPDDILWTHYEQRGCERLAWALLREHSPVSISQWYCIWVTAGSFCLSNLSLQLCWNRQHASLISHAVSMGKWSLGVLDQCCHPLFTLLLRHA